MKRLLAMNYTIFKKYTGRTIISKFLFWYTIKAECIGVNTEWMDGSENPEFKYWRRLGKEDIINFEIKLKYGNLRSEKAKIKLEHDIEVLLNKFDKSCKTKTIGISHSYSHPKAFGGSDLDQVFHAIKLKIEI